MAKYVIGDIHGGHLALLQVLEKCNFNKEEDTLIILGDVVDSWPDTVKVIDTLLTIKKLFPIMGNHDFWCYNWLRYGWAPETWLKQGGDITYFNYKEQENSDKIKNKHKQKYFDKCNAYYIDDKKNAFVHGGYLSINGLGDDTLDTYMWDRSLWNKAKSAKEVQLNLAKMYNKVFIGHTSIGNIEPQKKGGNVWNLDTGGGWEGKLTIMNVDTEEFWQSDLLNDLYPEKAWLNKIKEKLIF